MLRCGFSGLCAFESDYPSEKVIVSRKFQDNFTVAALSRLFNRNTLNTKGMQNLKKKKKLKQTNKNHTQKYCISKEGDLVVVSFSKVNAVSEITKDFFQFVEAVKEEFPCFLNHGPLLLGFCFKCIVVGRILFNSFNSYYNFGHYLRT